MERIHRVVFTFFAIGIGLFGPAASAIAQSVEAGTGTIQPTVGEQEPLLDEPPVLTDAQRELAERALQKSHLPVPFPVVPGTSEAAPTSPPSLPD